MDISNPRRILAVSLEDDSIHLSRVVKDLTGSAPETAGTTLAGASHTLPLKTAYYTASVPIWLDLIADPSEWSASFLSAEAKEVLEVLGGLVVVFPLPLKPDSDEAKAARALIEHVGKVVQKGLGGWAWDGVGLCVGVGEIDDVDEWDGCAAECGLEFVQVRAKGSEARNEFGGRWFPFLLLFLSPLKIYVGDMYILSLANAFSTEKTGISRAKEALEANEWDQVGGDDLGSDFGDFEAALDGDDDDSKDTDLDPESLDFGFDREDFQGLKKAIFSAGETDEDGEDFMNGEPPGQQKTKKEGPDNADTSREGDDKLDDAEVQKLEGMMRKLQAVRDMSAGLPEDQRKRMAAKAVGEVMKDL
ncbi:hypothetical protein PG993_010951 [Apiospora rasikravindrae]|uniref:Alpha and gamma adaptin binding protein p34 n=1 Tax=Apiospora rasikravindrae TaxID=990691 RepID=A0ABR1SCS1_9PEZI